MQLREHVNFTNKNLIEWQKVSFGAKIKAEVEKTYVY